MKCKHLVCQTSNTKAYTRSQTVHQACKRVCVCHVFVFNFLSYQKICKFKSINLCNALSFSMMSVKTRDSIIPIIF